ncbi:MAG: hypothetical protein MJY88_03425 [Bacteroidales bacterium]|nr:hypothetical protein [Bacteroidales bacterium]
MDENKDWMTLHNVTETEYSACPDDRLDELKGQQLRLGIITALEYKEGIDVVKLNIGFRVVAGEKTAVISYALSFIVELNGWADMSHNEADVRINPLIRRMVKFCYPFLGGALMKKTEDTKLAKMYLPVVDADELMKRMIIEKSDK